MRFSNTVMWAVQQELAAAGDVSVDVFVVCDDWLVVAESEAVCRRVWLLIIAMLQRLGFTVNTAAHMCIAPTWVLTWLGLELDSERMTVRLPAEKVAKALAVVREVLASKKVSRRLLDSVFGYLSYCSAVVHGGRAFLHGLRRLRFRGGFEASGARAAHHRVYVNAYLRLDLLCGCAAWSCATGTGVFRSFRCERSIGRKASIAQDARGGSGGVGIFVNGGFLGLTGAGCNRHYPAGGHLVSPGCWATPSVEANHWEMFAFCVFTDLFPMVAVNKYIVVFSDSMSAMKCVRDLSVALDSPQLADLTRRFLMMTVLVTVGVLPRHVRGVDNVLADPLSRDAYSKFGAVANAWSQERGFAWSPFLASL
jgi:hypothetical protein